MSDLIASGLGAIVGFLLSQLVNLARVAREAWLEPRLVILTRKEACCFAHEASSGGHVVYASYGFKIKNVGRRIATVLRFQLLEVEINDGTVHSYEWANVYEIDSAPMTLLPSSSADVVIARESENHACLNLNTKIEPYMYMEFADAAKMFRFKVAAFDDCGRFASTELRLHLDKTILCKTTSIGLGFFS